MTYTSSRCQHGWLSAKDCETCKLLAEVTALRAAYIERAKEPVREWVGLTEDEAHECFKSANVWTAVEAMLKQKNTAQS